MNVRLRRFLAGRGGLLLGLLALAALGLVHSAAKGQGLADEAWFLRVCDRVAHGDTLYRDIFFGVTPLSVWLGAPAVALFGTEVIVVKALVAAALAASGASAGIALRRLGADRRTAALLAVVIVVTPGVVAGSLYTQLAMALQIGAMAAVLGWRPGESRRPLVIAGALAGLTWATKQNLGTTTALALIVALVALGGWHLRPLLKNAATLAVPGFAILALVLVPVLLSGGWARFVEFGFGAKGTYLSHAGASVGDGIRPLGSLVTGLPNDLSPEHLELTLATAGYLLVAGGALLVLAAFVTVSLARRPMVVVGAFLVAAVANVYPRADLTHLRDVLPMALLVTTAAARALLIGHRSARRVAFWLATAWAAALALATMAVPSYRLARGTLEIEDVHPQRGTLVSPEQHARLHAARTRLKLVGRTHRSVLMLGSTAALGELLGDLHSPTPYDFPVASALGRDGAATTAALVRDGRVDAACIAPSLASLRATSVEAAVHRALPRRTDLDICILYTRG